MKNQQITTMTFNHWPKIAFLWSETVFSICLLFVLRSKSATILWIEQRKIDLKRERKKNYLWAWKSINRWRDDYWNVKMMLHLLFICFEYEADLFLNGPISKVNRVNKAAQFEQFHCIEAKEKKIKQKTNQMLECKKLEPNCVPFIWLALRHKLCSKAHNFAVNYEKSRRVKHFFHTSCFVFYFSFYFLFIRWFTLFLLCIEHNDFNWHQQQQSVQPKQIGRFAELFISHV